MDNVSIVLQPSARDLTIGITTSVRPLRIPDHHERDPSRNRSAQSCIVNEQNVDLLVATQLGPLHSVSSPKNLGQTFQARFIKSTIVFSARLQGAKRVRAHAHAGAVKVIGANVPPTVTDDLDEGPIILHGMWNCDPSR